MPVAATDADHRGEQIARRLEGRLFGTTSVLRASARIAPDWDDEISLYIDVVLNDPDGDTWPRHDVRELRHTALDIAHGVGLDMLVYVKLSPETEVPQADDDLTLFPASP
jgi:hypothetical protein